MTRPALKPALLALALALSAPGPAWAVLPDERLENPVLETRARDISKNLRCLVCQNQSIDDSEADLARDLRILVRERLVAGDSDDEVIAFVVDRYGDYVLLTPPVKGTTILLWAAPILLAGAAGAGAWVAVRSAGRKTEETPS
ncbi:cytochrome c-type biogenesis protein [Caenispirillum salinarum]|uniref:cytochrome c-type biogenesis protein n=1 Tax=Caenispirillum salinarum TaxID=859058 RepID=UPI00384EE117